MFKFVECRHVLADGRKCHAPALRGKSYCYHHTKLHFRRWGAREPRMLKTLALNDPRGLQTAVAEVLTTLRSPLTDPKRAAVILYGLNLANNLSKQTQKQTNAPNGKKSLRMSAPGVTPGLRKSRTPAQLQSPSILGTLPCAADRESPRPHLLHPERDRR